MALNFPNSPSNGDMHMDLLTILVRVFGQSRCYCGDNAQVVKNGSLFDSSTAKLYIRHEDGSSNQWASLVFQVDEHNCICEYFCVTLLNGEI